MTIPVGLEALAETMARYPYAYLLTVRDDLRPHAVAVTPVWDPDGCLDVEVGTTTGRNADARPAVSLVFPPGEVGGYSLIVDAAASAGAPGHTVLTPQRAVLHRPAPEPRDAPEGGCVHDCQPIALPER
jgi:hypothetical protein